MPTKEEEFKQRFAAVLMDLEANGRKDAEAMWLLGSLAASLIDKAGRKSWTELKQNISQDDYTRLLTDFQNEGNRQHQDGSAKKAYVIQILGISLVAVTQIDEQVAAGEALLDQIVETSILIYRQNPAGTSIAH